MQPTPGTAAKPATAARIYDYMLGGVHNFPADREAARRIIEQYPSAPAALKANRAFVGRAVRFLVDQGIRQFLALGSGIPTVGNVHEIAQEMAPQARIVYVDIDPVAVAESQEMLEHNPYAVALRADMRDIDGILAHPLLTKVLDLDQPVAVLLGSVLHFIPDDVQAYALVDRVVSRVAPGSYLLVSHGATEALDTQDERLGEVLTVYQERTTTPADSRDRGQVQRFFAGLDLVDPGVVWTCQWRPDPGGSDPLLANPSQSNAWCGVAAKP